MRLTPVTGRSILAVLAMLAFTDVALAQNQPRRQPLPPVLLQISDAVGVLSREEGAALSQLLFDIEEKTGTKIIMVIIPTVTSENVAAYTQRLANRWINSGRLRNDGRFVFVVIANDDRVLWVAPSNKLRRIRKPLENNETLREAHELLRQDEYYEALTAIAQTLLLLIRVPVVI